jgi:hypothetical protein
MHSLLIIICVGAAYLSFGTIIAACTTLYLPVSIKAKVIILTYGQPLAFCFLIFACFPNTQPDEKLLWVGVIAGSMLRDIFSTRRYLTHVEITANAMRVYCLTPLLRKRQFECVVDDGCELRPDKLKRWIDCPPSLRFNKDGEEASFIVPDKKMYMEVKDAAIHSFGRAQ